MAQIENNSRSNLKCLTGQTTLRVDLTPMVDLGFLLISFFMLSTTLSQRNVSNLIMPKDSGVQTPVGRSATLTLMPVRNNEINYYEGDKRLPELIMHCSYAELRSVIQRKQQMVADVLGDKNKTVIIIDPGDESSYKNFIDLLDEIQINDIRHYFIVDHPNP